MQEVIQEKTNEQRSKTLFNNPLIEKLTRTHISVPLLIFYTASAGLVYYGSTHSSLGWTKLLAVFGVGFMLFTLVEYLVHRHVFHMLPTSKIKEWVAYNFHGVHHDYPKDKSRLVMPPLVSVILATILFSACYFVIGDWAYGFLPGFLSGYASYLAVHYIVHAFRPPKNVFKVLWIHHGIHHYKDDTVAYGVSSPFWDWVFGTMPKKN
jgi:sterol desaturase/sphingolipid hydroxylase (fatty acid hydroxylase superfamily)